MLLESRITIIDPKNRNLDLSSIIGPHPSWEPCELSKYGIQSQLTIQRAWVSLQGPGGILAKLNSLGLVNENRKPFNILTQQEYNYQIASTCIII